MESSAQINGVGAQYFDVKGVALLEGRLFDADSLRSRAQHVVIDRNTRDTLFAGPGGRATGQLLLTGRLPSRVAVVVEPRTCGFGPNSRHAVHPPSLPNPA